MYTFYIKNEKKPMKEKCCIVIKFKKHVWFWIVFRTYSTILYNVQYGTETVQW